MLDLISMSVHCCGLLSRLSSLQGVHCEEAFVLLLRAGVEEPQVEEQRISAAGSQLLQQGEPRYDVFPQFSVLRQIRNRFQFLVITDSNAEAF